MLPLSLRNKHPTNPPEGQLVASSNPSEGQLVASSNPPEGQLVASSNPPEGQLVASSNQCEGKNHAQNYHINHSSKPLLYHLPNLSKPPLLPLPTHHHFLPTSPPALIRHSNHPSLSVHHPLLLTVFPKYQCSSPSISLSSNVFKSSSSSGGSPSSLSSPLYSP